MQPGSKLLITTAAMAAVALAAICLLTLSFARVHAEPVPGLEHVKQRANFKLPQLFDFGYFKERFGKRYKSLVDELVHRTYFVARASRAYVTGIKYKFRKLTYCLALNHLSDVSPQELEALKNKKLVADRLNQTHSTTILPLAPEAPTTDELLTPDGESYRERVEDLLENHPDMQLPTEESDSSTGKKAPRNLSLEDLIEPGVNETVREPAEVEEKIANDVDETSNSSQSQQPDGGSQTLDQDDFVELRGWMIPPKESVAEKQNEPEEEPKDMMYFDHRDSNCLMQPRNQGRCSSCYAFASTALMEWLYCMKKGELVPFSEQYLLDCGNERLENELWGCEGGSDYGTFEFIANYGVERAKNYPYHAKVHQCPYHKDTSIRASGYIRMNLDDYVLVPVSRWAEYIKYAPLYVVVAAPADFPEFSTGVHNGLNCDNEPNHAMLLVGHGREDGTEFWLLRNSFGPNWGVGGYFRLSKDAPLRCINRQLGYALGTKDAINYITPEKNQENKMLRKLKEGLSSGDGDSSRQDMSSHEDTEKKEESDAQGPQWKYK